MVLSSRNTRASPSTLVANASPLIASAWRSLSYVIRIWHDRTHWSPTVLVRISALIETARSWRRHQVNLRIKARSIAAWALWTPVLIRLSIEWSLISLLVWTVQRRGDETSSLLKEAIGDANVDGARVRRVLQVGV